MSILGETWAWVPEGRTKLFHVVAWGQTVGRARGMQLFIIDLLVVLAF